MSLYADAAISKEKNYSMYNTCAIMHVIVLNVSFSSRQKTKEYVLRERTHK